MAERGSKAVRGGGRGGGGRERVVGERGGSGEERVVGGRGE